MERRLQLSEELEKTTKDRPVQRFLLSLAALVFQSVTIGIAVVALLLAVVNEVL
jgi:hypothetical protein